MKSLYSILIASTAVLTLATGCVRYVERPGAGSVYVEPPPVQTVFIEDDYVYYPRYGMYYGSRSHSYYYQQGSSWVARPAPRGVSVNVLSSSPSVAVDFHDRPAMHHAQVVQSFPRNWRPSGQPGQRVGQREDRREENHNR